MIAQRPPPATPFRPTDFLRLLMGAPAWAMLTMILVQETCGAASTWLVIHIAREITAASLPLAAFFWIVVAQTVAYVAGAISWIFAERAGFGAYSRYMLRFARENRSQTALLGDASARERTEPFLTNETFHVIFELVFSVQFHLRIFFQLLFNALVLGYEIDSALPAAFAAAFIVLALLQWALRKPLAAAYLHNQQMSNRMTARTYNAWDNVFSGNRYNFRHWHRDFRHRLRHALSAQVRAILLREGWSAISGLIALSLVLSTTAWIAVQDAGNIGLLIALAATLPRQIEMTQDMHQFTVGLTDLLAIWTRIKGICEHMRPLPDPAFAQRIGFDQVLLREAGREIPCASLAEALRQCLDGTEGLVSVRGGNGSGKTTLLAALKAALHGRAYYWPTQDRLAFAFNTGETVDSRDEDVRATGHSSGERQLHALREIVANTDHPLYLLDEWDANLDPANRAAAVALVVKLAGRARVIEVSHRDVT